ncbi:hypothetical protein GCM10027418_07770 [Mariniluteicoccus endophyticus]
MAMNPDAGSPADTPTSGVPSPEWEIIERIPGDPWSAELVVWSGNDIDGVNVPLDDALVGAVTELRRRQDDIAGLDHDDVDPAGPGAPGASMGGPRTSSLLQGLGRTTGAAQADRWLSGVPVRYQVAGGVALLVVFVLVMLIGSLT